MLDHGRDFMSNCLPLKKRIAEKLKNISFLLFFLRMVAAPKKAKRARRMLITFQVDEKIKEAWVKAMRIDGEMEMSTWIRKTMNKRVQELGIQLTD